MGQYYKPVILKDNKRTVKNWMYSHDFDNGLKLMEHSYIGNTFVNAFESQLINNPQRVAWAGDYADDCRDRKSNLYQRCDESDKLQPNVEMINHDKYRFVINHTKKEFVDKRSIPEIEGWDGTQIHPLPLMTCEGNNRGGGDFRGDEKNIVGRWARDVISVASEYPIEFRQIKFDLRE
jgi:hypothetical protein